MPILELSEVQRLGETEMTYLRTLYGLSAVEDCSKLITGSHVLTNGQRILTRGRIARGSDFSSV